MSNLTEVEKYRFDFYANQLIEIRQQIETLMQTEKFIEEQIIREHKQFDDTGRLTDLIHPERITTDKYSIVVEEEMNNIQIIKHEG